MALREIVPGILTWPWFSERHGYDFNGYLIRSPDGNVAVDPVEGEIDEDVKRIVLTNRNHFRAAAKLRAEKNARVAVHPADAEFVRRNGVEVDDALKYGDGVAGFTVIDAHGKSPGEIALWDERRKLLIVGDACVGKPAGAFALLPPKVIDDLPALQQSLRRLAGLQPSIVLVGDGAPVLHDAAAALDALVRSFS
jgi:glyoxylase-like metal-dependent hydrolase (beta-lactamase superfamily II)